MHAPATLSRSSGHGCEKTAIRRTRLVGRERDRFEHVALWKHQRYGLAGKQPLAASHDRVEHRLRVGDRAADDAQDLCRCGLPFERFSRLVEQPRVLDRDHSLVGEGLEESILPLAQLVALVAEHGQRPNAAGPPTSAVRPRPTFRAACAARPARPVGRHRCRCECREPRPAAQTEWPSRSACRPRGAEAGAHVALECVGFRGPQRCARCRRQAE